MLANELLKNLSTQELSNLIGSDIIKSISQYFNTDTSYELAEILLLKEGEKIFDSKNVRLCIIDTLDEKTLIEFCYYIFNETHEYFTAMDKLREHFKSYSYEKSCQFVDFFNLSNVYYKKTVKDDREASVIVSSSFGEEVKLKGYLHPYQKNVKDQVLKMLNVRDERRMMVQMPTGAGKTFTALETVVDILRRPFQKKFVVWLVNSNELAEQAMSSFSSLWKIKGDRSISAMRLFNKFFPDFINTSEGGVVFATYGVITNTLKKDQSHQKYKELEYLFKNTEYLIIDEAHSVVAETYFECIDKFEYGTKIVGLSATPIRNHEDELQHLNEVFNGHLIQIKNKENTIADPIKFLQNEGYLAKIKMEILKTGTVSNENDEKKLLKQLSIDSKRNKIIIDAIKFAEQMNDKTIVFACTMDHVISLYILCKQAGINTEFIIGNTPQNKRIRILKDFSNNKVNVLINLDILSTGIDLPNVNRIIITRPIRSAIQYSQIIGRALRGPKNGGNTQNTVINITDNLKYFDDISYLYANFSEQWS